MAPRVYPRRRRAVKSANIITKRKFKKKNVKTVVAPSFRQAYKLMQPPKEIRYDYYDLNMDSATSMATRSQVLAIDNIAQGTQVNQRLGSSVRTSWLHIKMSMANNSTVKSKALRVMVVREVNNGGLNTGTLANLFKSVGTATHTPNGSQTDLKWPLNRDLVYPKYDRVFKLPVEAESFFRRYLKIPLRSTFRYSPTNSAATTPVHGRTYIIVLLADLDNLPTATICVFDSCVRLFFKDGLRSRSG